MDTYQIDPEVLEEFRHFSAEEMDEIKSDLNKWGTGLEFGCEPDLPHEAIHYIKTADGSLYCKYPHVKELAGEKKVLPDMTMYNTVQVVIAQMEFERYKETHDGLEPEIPEIPKHLPKEEERKYVLMMFFYQTGMAEFHEHYTCPERLLGIPTEELKCQHL